MSVQAIEIVSEIVSGGLTVTDLVATAMCRMTYQVVETKIINRMILVNSNNYGHKYIQPFQRYAYST